MRPTVNRRFSLVMLLWGVLAACTYTIKTQVPDLPGPAPLERPILVAMLAPVDLRLRNGGGKTHVKELVPNSGMAQQYNDPRMFRNPNYGWGGGYYGGPSPRSDDVKIRTTGELGTDEVLLPLTDAFEARFSALIGENNLRDASEDALADQPDMTRAQGFLAAYPVYDAVVWIEVMEAHADLPDEGALQSLFTLGSVCSLGLLSWTFLIPVDLATPITVKARAYLIFRSAPAAPIAIAAVEDIKLEARGSVAFDVDKFRADAADVVGRRVGVQLADGLGAKLPR